MAMQLIDRPNIDEIERLLIIGRDLIAACRNWEKDPEHCIKMIERLETYCGK